MYPRVGDTRHLGDTLGATNHNGLPNNFFEACLRTSFGLRRNDGPSILIYPTFAHAGGDVRSGFREGQNGLDRGRLGQQFNGGEIGARKRQRVEWIHAMELCCSSLKRQEADPIVSASLFFISGLSRVSPW